VVSQSIFTGLHFRAGVEVSIRKIKYRGRMNLQPIQEAPVIVGRTVDTFDVPRLRLRIGNLDRQVRSRAYLGDDFDDDCEQMRSQSGLPVCIGPMTLIIRLAELTDEATVFGVVRIRRELFSMQNNFGIGKNRYQGANGAAVAFHSRQSFAHQLANLDSVSGYEGAFQQAARDSEADEPHECRRSKSAF